jgi:hypothetical protein
MDFLLPKEQLKGLSPEDQKAVKDEAFNQFLLGSIFGGGGIATGYQAVQNIIPNLQKQRQQQGLLSELGAIQNEFFPTQAQAGQRALVNQPTRTSADFGPSPEAALRQQQILSAGPNYADLQTRLAKLALNPAAAPLIPSLQSSFGAFKPNITDGIATDIRNRPTAVIPRADLKSGLTLTGTVQDGNVAFNTGAIPGFAKAAALNTIPKLKENQEFVFDRNQNAIGVRNMDGTIQAIQAVATAEQMGKGLANLQTTPTDVIDIPTGRKKRVTEAQALGMPTALSPSEQQAYEGYKPIRDAAFLGAESAKASDISLQNLQNILNRGNFKPGKFAVAQSEIASIATGLGIGGERARLMSTDSALTVQAVSDITASRIKEMGSAISNADVTFSAARGPQISNQEEAMQFYIDLNSVINKRKKDYSNYVNKNAVPDVAEKWSQTAQGSSSVYEDPKLRKYLPRKEITRGPDKGKIAYILPNGDATMFD